MLRTGRLLNTRWHIRPPSSTYAHPTLLFFFRVIFIIFS